MSGTLRRMVARFSPITWSEYATLSYTVRFGSSLKSWKTTPMLRRSRGTFLRGIERSSWPEIRISPSCASISFISRRMQVDLPQPVGPTRKTNSPRPIRSETRSTPTEPPSYSFVTSRNSTTGTSRRGFGVRAGVFSLVRAGIAGYRDSAPRPFFLGLQRTLQAIAAEQMSFVLEQRDERARDRLVHGIAGEDRERRPAGELRRYREEQLVHEALADERLVQARPAL